MFRKSQSIYSRIPSQGIFPSAPISRSRLYFETLPDGRIPVTNDLSYVMHCLTSFTSLCVQAEHIYGRLSVLMNREEFKSNFAGPLLNGGAFFSHFKTEPCERWAKLENCKCCGSPGNLSFYNSHGERFFQICAPHDVEPREWAIFLSLVTVKPAILPESPTLCDSTSTHPIAPNKLEELHIPKWAFFKFLDYLSKSEECLQFNLPTAHLSFKRDFRIYEIFEDCGTLICRGNNVGLSLSLSAIRGFALIQNKTNESLLCLGTEQNVLMEISLSDNLKSAGYWNLAIKSLRETAS
jgi:hypothetical protein